MNSFALENCSFTVECFEKIDDDSYMLSGWFDTYPFAFRQMKGKLSVRVYRDGRELLDFDSTPVYQSSIHFRKAITDVSEAVHWLYGEFVAFVGSEDCIVKSDE